MLKSPKILHIEPTDVCQAACPSCARETNVSFDKSLHNHLTVEQIRKYCDENTIKNLTKVFACGNYGDPAAAKHLFEIFRWLRSINPTITLGMNTNGAIQNEKWWEELGLILNHPLDYVVFSIDGLKDTNHIYRKNIDWDKLMENAKAFISTNSSAHWDMLVYRHNEHQVNEAIQLAKLMGFRWFRAKVSKRPLVDDLEFPIEWESVQKTSDGKIVCHALNEESIYIDARGQLHPCCWLGNDLSNPFKTIDEVKPLWKINPPDTCKKTCTKTDKSIFENQWKLEIQL